MRTKNQLKTLLPIIDAIPASIYWKDKSGNYLGCNKYMFEMMGLNRNDIIGKNDHDLICKETADKVQQIDSLVVKSNTKHEVEETVVLADAQEHTFLSTKTPLYDETTGETIGIIGVSIDITDRKKADQLQKQKEKLMYEQLSHAVETLSGCVAHEIRTPLSIIGINTDRLQMILKSKSDPHNKEDKENKARELITNIRFAIKSASNIINMLLVKLHSVFNKQLDPIKPELNSIKSCINEALHEYPFYSNEQDAIVWDKNSAVDFTYLGDHLMTKHALFNLIKNSLKAIQQAEHGKIYITLRSGKDHNQLIFKDTASGLSTKAAACLFKNFNTETKDGAGLGLSFCKLIMKSYGGDITCTSKKGKHTEFTLSFPAIEPHS